MPVHTHHLEVTFLAGLGTKTLKLDPRLGHAHWSVRVVSGNLGQNQVLRFADGTRLTHGNTDMIAIGPDATVSVPVTYRSGPVSFRITDLFGATVSLTTPVIVLLEFAEMG